MPGQKVKASGSEGATGGGPENVRTKAERLEAIRREQRRAERRSQLMIWGAGGVAVLLVAGGASFAVYKEGHSGIDMSAVQTIVENDRNHVTTAVTYTQTPPVGGNHDPVWLNCGIYDHAVRNENAVHDLEHGAVWVTYNPSLGADQVSALKAVVGTQTYILMSPYPGLPAPVVATAWNRQLKLTGVDDPRLPEFIKLYRQGPQTPEPGAACTGGISG